MIKLELPTQRLYNLPNLKAIASLVVAIFAIAFVAIFIRWSEGEISPSATIFNRFWIATVLFGLWNGFKTTYQLLSDKQPVEQQPYTSREVWLLLAVGIFACGYQLTWAWSLTQTDIAISTLLHNLVPLFTTLGGWLLFGQRFDSRFLSGMVIAIGGASAIGLTDLQVGAGKVEGDLSALLSAIFYGGYLLSIEQLQTKLTTTIIVLWCSGLGSLFTLPILLLTHDALFPYSWNGWLAVICLAAIGQLLGQGLMTYSLNKLSSGFVALSHLSEVILSGILAWLFFSEQLSLFDWGAIIVVLVGLYLAISSDSSVKNKSVSCEQVSVEQHIEG
jgi:drug/metabolite transporter (DMT)-like permease